MVTKLINNTIKLKHKNMYYTENKREVTDRIDDGRTQFFNKSLINSQERAEKLASEKGSYVYPVFSYEGIGIKQKFEFVGYGIPN